MVETTLKPRSASFQGCLPYFKAQINKAYRIAPTDPEPKWRVVCAVRGDGVGRLG